MKYGILLMVQVPLDVNILKLNSSNVHVILLQIARRKLQ